MERDDILRYGAIALFTIGFLALVGFALGSNSTLEGEIWLMQQIHVDGETVAAAQPDLPDANFDSETGTLSGATVCTQRYEAPYEADKESMSIGAVTVTPPTCDKAGMIEDLAYFALLETIDGYRIDVDQLTLSVGDNDVIVFTAAGS